MHETNHSERGDERYLAQLVSAQPALRGIVHAIVRRPSDVDDIVQETNMVLWRKREEYDPERPFKAWACRIAHLQALAFLKKERGKAKVPFEDDLVGAIADEAVAQAEQAERRTKALRDCIEKLSGHHRDLLNHRYSRGISVSGIAELMGRSADAISMSLYRIRKSLLECIEHRLATGENT
ncbi:RNA polymerase sigma factor CnrH [Planctomycetes bacterium Pan216]|uniref:RNA polymerase sigma factor CnrH n=1 Tax=Kolteria novifilia TaxID=2527975 RepID=A0A518B401_9BACT|nr:RNA polymerase sigma factor CnrH [Planctomycetes bacterium Pan216]